jgi:signal transduction histidine kinase
MRRRILGACMLVAALAVLLFGLPLAYSVIQLEESYEEDRLENTLLRVSAQAAAQAGNEAGMVAVVEKADGRIRFALYDLQGRRLGGTGPPVAGPSVAEALQGVEAEHSGRQIVMAGPVRDGDRVAAVLRASMPQRATAEATPVWAGMAVLAVLAAGASFPVAGRLAKGLAQPLIQLEKAAEELGDGNFAVRRTACGVVEIDRASAALNRTAGRLDDVLARERAFTAVASHQLRTPLTDLRLGLEDALSAPDEELRRSVRAAIVGADRLSDTIDDVLALARGSTTATALSARSVLADVRFRWQAQLATAGRRLEIVDEDPPPAMASAAAVRQILDVLVANASLHGTGTVTVTARAAAGAVAIDVADEGHTDQPLVPEASAPLDAPRRLGLSIAASLAASQNGRLVHARTAPRTKLTLLLPAAEPSTGTQQ